MLVYAIVIALAGAFLYALLRSICKTARDNAEIRRNLMDVYKYDEDGNLIPRK